MSKFYNRVKIANEELKDVIAEDKLANRFNVAVEYQAIDIPEFFLGSMNTWWRAVMNDTSVSRENVGLLIDIFLSKFSTGFDKYFMIWFNYGWSFGSTITFNWWNPLAWADLITRARVIESSKHGANEDASFFKSKSLNAYYNLIIDYKNVRWEYPDAYEKLVFAFRATIEQALSDGGLCKEIPPRDATIGEKHDIKLLKPEKIEKEIAAAMHYVNTKIIQNKENGKKWEKIYKQLMDTLNRLQKAMVESIHSDF